SGLPCSSDDLNKPASLPLKLSVALHFRRGPTPDCNRDFRPDHRGIGEAFAGRPRDRFVPFERYLERAGTKAAAGDGLPFRTFRMEHDMARAAAEGPASSHELDAERAHALPVVRKIGMGDLRAALAMGLDDFLAKPSHVLFLGILYPLIGIIAARLAFGYGLLPLLYPLVAGIS